MKSHLLLALLASLATAGPLEIRQSSPTATQETPLPTSNDVVIDIDPSLINKSILEIVADEDSTLSLERRGMPDGQREALLATDVGAKPAQQGSKQGVFYRGDTRSPSEIFESGFTPQGENKDLRNHLSFGKDSGYVSESLSLVVNNHFTQAALDLVRALVPSQSRDSATAYAFGRTGAKQETGYVYRISPQGLPEGYWLPELYPNDPAVRQNQEFAVSGNIPPESIQAAYEVNSNTPGSKGKLTQNPKFAYKNSVCSIQKRDICFPMPESDEEPSTKKPGTNVPDEEPSTKKPGTNVPDEKGPGGSGNKKLPVGENIAGNKFLQWVSEASPEAFKPLAEAIMEGSISVHDCELAFKRALSVAMEKRYTEFGSAEKAAESLKNIVVDIFNTVRFAVPVGFWESVIQELPAIAKEVSEGKTPEEKLQIANKDINPVVTAWSATPIGQLNESLMKEAANNTPVVQGVAVSINKLWSYTPFGWIINQIFPVEPLIRKINVRSVPIYFYV